MDRMACLSAGPATEANLLSLSQVRRGLNRRSVLLRVWKNDDLKGQEERVPSVSDVKTDDCD